MKTAFHNYPINFVQNSAEVWTLLKRRQYLENMYEISNKKTVNFKFYFFAILLIARRTTKLLNGERSTKVMR